MFTTRKQVDEHVHKILANLPPGNQRDIKGLAVARLYYKIQEYQKAIEYLTCYLRSKDEAVPHKLIAHSYKLLKTPDLQRALQHYQRCIQINPRQPDVIKEVCQLLVDEKSVFNKECAKFWLDLATSENLSDNEAVVSLRMRVNLTESNGNGDVGDGGSGRDNEDALEMIMHKELQARPQDVNVRVRLMRSYVEKNQLDQAFKYAYKVELEATGCTSQSSEWYGIVWMMLSKKEDKRNLKDWRFWQLALHTCDRLMQLSLEAGNALAESSNLLFRLDQYLHKFSTVLDRSTDAPQRELHLSCVDHYAGQLLLHAVALIFKRELLGNKNKWMSVLRSILPMLLLGYQVRPLQEQHVHPWMKHCDAEQKQLLQLWRQQGSFRCAQLGRVLLGCLDRSQADQENQKNNNQSTQTLSGLFLDSEELLNCARQQCMDKNWRSQVYQILFTHAEHKLKEQSSHLVRHPRLQTPVFEWPDLVEIETYEQQALLLQPRTLAQHVYLALGTDIDSLGEAPRVLFYEEFRRDVKQNLSYCGHDSISQVDVDLYLYATVIQTQRKLELLRSIYDSSHPGSRNAAARPHMMPYANLLSQLATPEQSSWWDIVLRLHRNQQMPADSNRAEQRAQLQLGLEAVRGVNGPKADAIIIFQLGKILQSRDDRASLESRIDVLYRQGLTMLRRHQQQHQFEPFVRIFKYGSASSTAAWNKLQTLAEHAVTYFSGKMFMAGQYEQFVDEVRGLDLPMATYLQAEAYSQMEASGKANRASRARYLERRQECLQQTQQLLRNNGKHPLNSTVQRELRRCQQQNRSAQLQGGGDDSFGSPDLHNNSSTYEDAEDDFYAAASLPVNRSRRHQLEISAASPVSSAVVVAQPSEEMEQTLKQISKSICLVTDNMAAMRQDITTLTERFNGLEDMIKKMKITNSRETPVRDVDPAAALGLDDLFIIEEALVEQQQQQQQHQAAIHQAAVLPQYGGPNQAFYNGVQSHAASAQDRFLPAPYGSPMFNQNQMYNYYAAQAQAQAQFMRTPPGPPGAMPPANLFGPRNPNYGIPSIFPPPSAGAPPVVPPFMDPMGNFTQPPTGSLIPPQPQPTQQQAPAPLNLAETKPPALPTPGVGAGFFNSPTPAFGVPTIQLPQSKPLTVPPAAGAPPPTAAAAAALPVPVPGPAPVNLAAPSVSAVPAPVSVPLKAPQVAPSVPVAAPASVPALFNRALNNQPVEKEPPANVVITSSDPLPKPTGASGVQPTLSVTIPAQHIKPSLVQPSVEPQQPPPVQSQPLQPTLPASGVFNFNMGNTVSESPFSFKSQVARAAAEKQKEQELEQAAAAELNKSGASDLNKSVGADGSSSLTEDYDPRPDFKAIIPLPDEVEVRTGEENEEVKFSYRAKLFRYVDKEWKERGTGLIKILRDKTTGVSRVLMRRDQTHKVCANHTITADMTLSTPSQDKDKKMLLWAANDFADEHLTLEKFLVRFKTAETAEEFRVAFVNATVETKTKFGQEPPKANKESTAFPSASAPFSLAKNFATSTPAAANPVLNKPAEQAKSKQATEPSMAKSLFGGVSSVTAAPPATAPAAPSPFANFSFSGLNTENKASPFGNLSFSNASAVGSGTNSTLFTTALNKDNTLQNQTPEKASTSDAEEEYEPTAEFTPVIALPELVEVVTGEENEEVLFEHRGKLLRFDKEANEWKERGLGDMKVLRDRNNPDQVRLLMRRDKVLKLCCNQRLSPDTNFSFAINQKAAVTWASMDYADEELTNALLCLRFKTPEICQNFLDAVHKAQESMKKGSAGKEEKILEKPQKQAEKEPEEKPIKGFGDAFKPKAGSWSCKACYTSNGQEQLYCLACQEPKDDTVPPKQPGLDQGNALNLTTSSSGKFSFGFAPAALPVSGGFSFGAVSKPSEPATEKAAAPVTATASAPASAASLQAAAVGKTTTTTTSGFGDAFKPKAGSWSCSACYVNNPGESLYCSACETPKDDTVPKKENALGSGLTLPATSQFNFGFSAKPVDQATKSSVFGSSTFNFQAPSVVAPAASLGSSGGFSFSMPKPSQQQPKSPAAPDGEDNDGYHEEEENNAYFAPVIPLPDKIDVKTGEENEELLYVHRAKLYRHTEGEWKERGLGDVKILRHKQTKKLRVVMRREQVFKICLNHVLNNEVVYKPKDEKSLLFAAHDFSEGESVLERFTLRFKNHDVVEEFSRAVKNALNGTAEAIKDNGDSPSTTVVNVGEKQQNQDQESSSCPGCRGCSPDKFVFAASSAPASSLTDDVSPPLPMFLPALQLPKSSAPAVPATSIFKASSLGASNSSFSAFGNLAVSEATKAPNSPAFLFGNVEKPASGAPLFGGNLQPKGNVLGSIFGSTNTDQSSGWDSAKSIFGGGQQEKDETAASKSIFGGAKIESPQQSAPITTPEVPKSIFGATSSVFGGKPPATGFLFGSGSNTSIFGQKETGSSFSDLSQQVKEKEDKPSTGSTTFQGLAGDGKKETVPFKNTTFADFGSKSSETFADFGSKSSETFADFAAKAGNDFADLTAKSQGTPIGFNKSSSGGFYNLTHQNEFKNFQSTPTQGAKNESQGDGDDGDANNDDNYDPQYDPIIELPDEIVVTTGEESETKLFGDRVKLFRFDSDTKAWKERGCGELKVLEHPEMQSFRLVLRQEQVHKLLLNMKITGATHFDYKNGLKKTLLWAGYNFAADAEGKISTDGAVEKLACRFAKEEIASLFLAKANDCIKRAALLEDSREEQEEHDDTAE